MRHLEQISGRESVLAVVYPDREPTDAVVESAVGLNLQSLDEAWGAWLGERYAARSDTAAVREAYTARTPWYDPCVEGVDY